LAKVACKEGIVDDEVGKPAIEDAVGRILHYHERTKHHLHQYARSAGYLD